MTKRDENVINVCLEIELVPAEETQKSVLRKLMEFYLYDFSEYLNFDVNEYGSFNFPNFEHYWIEETKHPFFIKVDDCFAGFV